MIGAKPVAHFVRDALCPLAHPVETIHFAGAAGLKPRHARRKSSSRRWRQLHSAHRISCANVCFNGAGEAVAWGTAGLPERGRITELFPHGKCAGIP